MTNQLPSQQSPSASPHLPPPHEAEPPGQRILQSQQILQGQQEILISHAGELYRLRLTRNGKLLLHK